MWRPCAARRPATQERLRRRSGHAGATQDLRMRSLEARPVVLRNGLRRLGASEVAAARQQKVMTPAAERASRQMVSSTDPNARGVGKSLRGKRKPSHIKSGSRGTALATAMWSFRADSSVSVLFAVSLIEAAPGIMASVATHVGAVTQSTRRIALVVGMRSSSMMLRRCIQYGRRWRGCGDGRTCGRTCPRVRVCACPSPGSGAMRSL